MRNISVKYTFLFIGLIGYTLAGLNWNIGIAAWIAPVFLLYYTKTTKWSGFFLFYLGMAVSAALSKTAENLSGLFIIYITTGLSHGAINSLPYVIEKLLARKEDGFYSTFIFPSAVVLIEYLLSLVLGIWGNSSIAQYNHLHFIQMTSLFGIFGISFMVAWLASLVNWFISRGFEKKYLIRGLSIYGAVILVVLIYGTIRTNMFTPRSETVRVAAIVSDADIHEIFNRYEEEIIEYSINDQFDIPENVYSSDAAIALQISKTKEAILNGPTIIVWNEISLILEQSQQDSLLLQLKKLCRESKVYVLAAFLEKNIGTLAKPFNNKSVLISPDGEIAWEYLKSVLNPIEKLIINRGEAVIPFIDSEYGRIGNVICADLDLPRYMSQIGKKRIELLLVPAYDWEKVTPYHSNMAAFAAIQYGTSLVRANGKGIVAMYDFKGNALSRMNTFTADSKIVYAEIPIQSTTTVYSIIGDAFVFFWIIFLLIVVGLKIAKNIGHSTN
jgi:apolipoprotein N-acyltransferase